MVCLVASLLVLAVAMLSIHRRHTRGCLRFECVMTVIGTPPLEAGRVYQAEAATQQQLHSPSGAPSRISCHPSLLAWKCQHRDALLLVPLLPWTSCTNMAGAAPAMLQLLHAPGARRAPACQLCVMEGLRNQNPSTLSTSHFKHELPSRRNSSHHVHTRAVPNKSELVQLYYNTA